MMLVSYRLEGTDSTWRAGVAQGELLVDVTAHQTEQTSATTDTCASAMRRILQQGPEYVAALMMWAEQQFDTGAQVLGLKSVKLGPPVPDPDKILCLGINYSEHSAEADISVPPVPMFFAKFRNTLIGDGSPIQLPATSQQVDYEGELAVVIGRRCKGVSEGEALQYVAGYSILNDVSARNLQFRTSQFIAGKTLDTFAPMGPGLVLSRDIPDPQKLELTTKVNGEVRQHASTGEMVYTVAHTVAFLSGLMTLEPGDVISTGTPAGVGFKRNPPVFLKAGDVVEISIEGIGTLRNPVRNA